MGGPVSMPVIRVVAAFLRQAGLEDLDADDAACSELIEWRGGVTEVWPDRTE
ncbi:hypothetical protein ACFY2N_07015 [Streptomyces rubiginosohelvolus]|uniref:hypothetical protein n=1 Tax=Streptomyces rubiginosohelvolus TaxID=67362 RepID=UPI0036A1B324